ALTLSLSVDRRDPELPASLPLVHHFLPFVGRKRAGIDAVLHKFLELGQADLPGDKNQIPVQGQVAAHESGIVRVDADAHTVAQPRAGRVLADVADIPQDVAAERADLDGD